MGSSYTIKLSHRPLLKEEFHQLKKDIHAMLDELNRSFSLYDRDSEINHFNQLKKTDYVKVSEPFFSAVSQAIAFSKETDGYLDVTVSPLVTLWGFGPDGFSKIPEDDEIRQALMATGTDKISVQKNDQSIRKVIPEVEIDLNSIAQGFAADRIAACLLKKNCMNFMVDVGGEFICRGKNSKNEWWKIGIETPEPSLFSGEKVAAVVELANKSLSTSGSYRRFIEKNQKTFSHILNPKSGKPVQGNLVSVTVIAETAASADAYATALFVMGQEKAWQWLKKQNYVEACMISTKQDGTFSIQMTDGFREREI